MIFNPKLKDSPFYWEGGPLSILLIHGFTATSAEVRPRARVLRASGYTVAGPLLPGHFTDPQNLNHVRWPEWINNPDVPDQIFNGVRSTVKEKYWLAKSSHCVILDQEFDQMARITCHFLDRVLSSEATKEPV